LVALKRKRSSAVKGRTDDMVGIEVVMEMDGGGICE
jgi:hypothetical protein